MEHPIRRGRKENSLGGQFPSTGEKGCSNVQAKTNCSGQQAHLLALAEAGARCSGGTAEKLLPGYLSGTFPGISYLIFCRLVPMCCLQDGNELPVLGVGPAANAW